MNVLNSIKETFDLTGIFGEKRAGAINKVFQKAIIEVTAEGGPVADIDQGKVYCSIGKMLLMLLIYLQGQQGPARKSKRQ